MNWQEVIDWIDGMAGRGELSAGDLREGLALLQTTPQPYNLVVDEKIAAWTWLLDNDQIPERQAEAGFIAEAAGSPLMWIAAAAALAFLVFRPKGRS